MRIRTLVAAFALGFFSWPSGPLAADAGMESRLTARRAVEAVYWRHRVWPVENTQPKPPLAALLSPEQLMAKVEDAAAMSQALEKWWNRPLAHDQLQAELDRMTRQSRAPELLRELFAALDDDPNRIVEAIVRPVLAERLLRSGFANDARFQSAEAPTFDAWWATERKSIAPALPEDLRSYRLNEVTGEPCVDGTWRPTSIEIPDARRQHVAVWTGAEMIIWGGSYSDTYPLLNTGGRYDPATDTWTPTSLAGAPTPRQNFTAVWTGAEMIVWGGLWESPPGQSNAVVNTGARYDPLTDTWSPTSTGPGSPAARSRHTAIWTGSQMVVWGGISASGGVQTGGRYEPATDSWLPTSIGANAPSARYDHTAVWTGSVMIVWGGNSFGGRLNTGGRYNPASDTWLPTSTGTNRPSARFGHAAVWTGSRMVVWGGSALAAGYDRVGGRYDPLADTWVPTSVTADTPVGRSALTMVWTGSDAIVWGGDRGSVSAPESTGARYFPVTDTWIATPTGGATPAARTQHSAVWTGSEMIVWGGRNQLILNSGGRFAPTSNSWFPTANSGSTPTARRNQKAVWTGSEMIIWGGAHGNDSYINTGGRYRPATDSWTPTNLAGAPAGRIGFSAVWTGNLMVVWGGSNASGSLNTGAKYNPFSNDWIATATTPWAPAPRFNHTAVWTGSEVIVWGGGDIVGGRYNPYLDSWIGTSTGPGLPAGRLDHAAVWTGSEMIVWGGQTPQGQALMDGSRYSPALDRWTPMSGVNAPSPRSAFPSIWTGSELIVWGGRTQTFGYVNTGAKYDAASDTWTPTLLAGAPAARHTHAAVWSGAEMIVWGGSPADPVGTGGRYDPAANSWTPVTNAAAPPARDLPSAVWTGSAAIFWGGDPVTASGGLYCAATPGCSGDPSSCDDGNPCTDDRCDPSTRECVYSPVVCEDLNPCTYDFCEPSFGCYFIETQCSDANACTVDFCDPVSGCGAFPLTCPDDGNGCTYGWCDPAAGCRTAAIDCTDSNACTTDSCDPATGLCRWDPIACDDGDPCTINSCVNGACIAAPGACGCDDGDPCTDDAYVPGTGCVHTVHDADGDGIGDGCDECPASDLRPTVIVRGCGSRVPNDVLPSGCTIADLFARCRLQSTSLRGYLTCVWQVVTQLRASGAITGIEAAKILKCAARRKDHDSRHRNGHGDRDDHSDHRGRRDDDSGHQRHRNHGQRGSNW